MYDHDIHLEQVKTYNTMLIEYNKLVIENSMRAQRGLMLCHGGAITAIIMSQQTELFLFCPWFGLGAILAVASSALGYWANLNYMSSWSKYTLGHTEEQTQTFSKKGRRLHRWAASVGIASGILFLCLVVVIGTKLWQ